MSDPRDERIRELIEAEEKSNAKLQLWKEKVKAMSECDMATIAELQAALAKTETELRDRTSRMADWKAKVKAITAIDQQRITVLEGVAEYYERRGEVLADEASDRSEVMQAMYRDRAVVVEKCVMKALRQ